MSEKLIILNDDTESEGTDNEMDIDDEEKYVDYKNLSEEEMKEITEEEIFLSEEDFENIKEFEKGSLSNSVYNLLKYKNTNFKKLQGNKTILKKITKFLTRFGYYEFLYLKTTTYYDQKYDEAILENIFFRCPNIISLDLNSEFKLSKLPNLENLKNLKILNISFKYFSSGEVDKTRILLNKMRNEHKFRYYEIPYKLNESSSLLSSIFPMLQIAS